MSKCELPVPVNFNMSNDPHLINMYKQGVTRISSIRNHVTSTEFFDRNSLQITHGIVSLKDGKKRSNRTLSRQFRYKLCNVFSLLTTL